MELKKGSVIQVTPESEAEKFRGCLMMVDEVKAWGVLAFVKIPGQGDAYLRLKTGDFEQVGDAPFQPEEDD